MLVNVDEKLDPNKNAASTTVAATAEESNTQGFEIQTIKRTSSITNNMNNMSMDIPTLRKYNSYNQQKHLNKTNYLKKLLKLGRIGVVENDDLQTNKFLSSNREWSSNNLDENASDKDVVLVTSVSTKSSCWNG